MDILPIAAVIVAAFVGGAGLGLRASRRNRHNPNSGLTQADLQAMTKEICEVVRQEGTKGREQMGRSMESIIASLGRIEGRQ